MLLPIVEALAPMLFVSTGGQQFLDVKDLLVLAGKSTALEKVHEN